MGVTFTRKEAAEPLTLRQQEALDMVGLGAPQPTPPKPKVVIKKKYELYAVGDRVRVTHGLFPWVLSYKLGSTGIVEKAYQAQTHPIAHPRGDVLYDVTLDNPTTDQTVILAGWELEKVA